MAADDSPNPKSEILCLCGNRCVLFDNKTNDETKKTVRVQQLLSCVNMVLDKNGGEPYTNEIFTELQKWKKKVEEQKHDDEHLTRIFEMRAAESYGQIWKLRLMNVEALKTAAKIDGACKAKNGAHNERETRNTTYQKLKLGIIMKANKFTILLNWLLSLYRQTTLNLVYRFEIILY
ncbi:hypothetical protein L6452_13297 [Arctium lappa]|uniref:Uncharacterized protein n=1 Tax=Arctium lappa TaxID=4217 RepID=A0ACB9CHV1_ARCLA|nr:hypothetical protein L6452_13297 [Arctium lappa]